MKELEITARHTREAVVTLTELNHTYESWAALTDVQKQNALLDFMKQNQYVSTTSFMKTEQLIDKPSTPGILEMELQRPAGVIKIICDGQCDKAWGITSRPSLPVSDEEDDVVYLADHELPQAPANPGTYEGFCGKPQSPDERLRFSDGRLNKWCIRECERSQYVEAGEPCVVKDWSQRVYNIPRKVEA